MNYLINLRLFNGLAVNTDLWIKRLFADISSLFPSDLIGGSLVERTGRVEWWTSGLVRMAWDLLTFSGSRCTLLPYPTARF